jgi:hypothetical protein
MPSMLDQTEGYFSNVGQGVVIFAVFLDFL